MKFIDTHAHLQFEKFALDRDEVVARNSSALEAVINPGADLNSSKNAVELAQKVDNFYAAVGVHPHHVDHWTSDYIDELEKLLTQDKVVAVGDIGLDNYLYSGSSKPDLEAQKEILIPQIELARAHKKPILFHCRQAYNELYEAIKNYQPLQGLMHCFMGDTTTARKFTDLGLLISFAGNLTYKGNDHMREVAASLPAEKILLETDSPYLAPEPLRGERNEPRNVALTAESLAQIRGVKVEEVSRFTTENARNLFSL